MVPDPERPIEKLLRDYAERRRQECRSPLELHPVDRKILQGEVAQVYGGAGQEPRRSVLWFLRPRRGLGVAAAALALVLMVGVLIRTETGRDRPAQQFAKRDERPVMERELLDKSKGTESDGSLVRSTISKEAASDKPAPTAVSAGAEQEARLKKDDFAASGGQPGGTLSVARFAAAPAAVQQAPLSETLFVAQSGNAAEPGVNVQLRQDTELKNLASSAKPASDQPAASILASFRVEQQGPEFRVIDQDGSIYKGTLGPAPTSGLASADEAGRVGASNAPRELAQKRMVQAYGLAPNPVAAQQQNAPQQNYLFRVAGTNVSSKQAVVFTGELLPLSNSVIMGSAARAAAVGGRGQLVPFGTQNLSLPSFQIQGQAVIGNRPVQINAQPAAKQ
ncbi:MAG TPA: hypothetical protein VHI52_07845 [Verrucomicrobiae bacterium]|nr:hypothetical protein [Verrucomicrobiae bacterium]